MNVKRDLREEEVQEYSIICPFFYWNCPFLNRALLVIMARGKHSNRSSLRASFCGPTASLRSVLVALTLKIHLKNKRAHLAEAFPTDKKFRSLKLKGKKE